MPGAGPRCHGACLNWPPPMRNLTPTLPQRPPPLEPPLSQMSDFSREGTTPPSTTAGHRQSPPFQHRYAPPPGPPPPPCRPRAASTSSGAGSTAPPTSDGHLTTTPPGHPLLRSGQTLSNMCVTCLIPLCSPIHLPARRPCPTRTHPTSRPQYRLQ
jgi:hypothetical protein